MINNAIANTNSRGFTLIEIIIALLVISVALGAVISTTASSVDHGVHIKQKTLSLWLARNHIAEMNISQQWPAPGQQSHKVSLSGKDWFFINKIIQTADKNIRRMEVSVYNDKDYENKILQLVTYINQPQLFNKDSSQQ